ncbi:transmembrane protein 214-A [Xenopus laevis]|uniref:Transmembrane protein 214-A n=1 Tax=Xenopus laevis TaxID=8355 RepID=T214A_XENLA|nr:transmembrane protein 214-A [Xenopus laevis]A0JMW6.1 RecName: Full=Transmembrane protein 214-A [Xenopus laevis]AAI26032.1 MGC154890 protein [Xenopus laevis]
MASGAPDGKWKVVKKGKKSGEKGGGRKALSESNVTPGGTAPIKMANTVYEMGFEQILKKQNKEQVPPNNIPAEQPQKKQQQQQNPGRKKPQSGDTGSRQRKFHTLEEGLKALDLAELQRELEKSQNMFPESPSIWVKDLAGYLNYKLQTVKNDVLIQQSHDYPYCLVNKELKGIVRSLLAKAPHVLDVMVDHCIFSMFQELDKPTGESLHGYRICLQAVLLDKPKTVTNNLPKYLELLRSQVNRPMKCLAVMWAVGQAGFTDLSEGLKVWLGLMFPVLGVKTLTPYAILYLDRLLLAHSNLTKGFGMIGPKDFFPLLDFAFMPNNSLTSSQQENLRNLYPRLKVLAFGATPESTLHTYFPSFLSRVTPSCPAEMRKELINSLTDCLNKDPLSFSVWRQLYTKHLSQSSFLLQHLVETWDSNSKAMRKSVRETVHSFKVTNGEFSGKGSSLKDLEACDAACQALLHKMKGSGFPWRRLIVIAFVFLFGFVFYDVRTHNSFQASTSHKVLQQSGLLSVSQQAWSKVSNYSLQGQSWLERNVPQYYSQAVEVLGPVLEQVWAKTQEGAAYACEKGSVLITYTKDNLPRLIEWLHSHTPDSVCQFIEYLRELLLHLHRTYLLPAVTYLEAAVQNAWQQYVASCNGKVTWDCVRGQVSNISHSSWTYLQNTTMTVTNWALSIISHH